MNHSQLQSCAKNVHQFTEKTKGVIRIGLQFITSWHSKGKIEINKDYRNGIRGILDRLVIDLGKKKPKSTTPNFIGCWMLNDELIDYENEYIYPGLILAAKFHDMIEHDGSKL